MFLTNTDYIARQKVGGIHLSYFIFYQLPIIPLHMVEKFHIDFVILRVLELSYTSYSLKGFAKDCGYTGPPFRWNEERRFLIRCELDAAFFHLYGIERDDLDYIMETFPIVKRKDEKKYNKYRTKRVILEIYDAMARAIEAGISYETILNPPPSDLRAAHSLKR